MAAPSKAVEIARVIKAELKGVADQRHFLKDAATLWADPLEVREGGGVEKEEDREVADGEEFEVEGVGVEVPEAAQEHHKSKD